MACNLNTKEFKAVSSQIGMRPAIQLMNHNNGVIPSAKTAINVKVGDIVGEKEFNSILEELDKFNSNNNIISHIKYTESPYGYRIDDIVDNYSEYSIFSNQSISLKEQNDLFASTPISEVSPEQLINDGSDYSTPERILNHEIDSKTTHELELTNMKRDELGKKRVRKSNDEEETEEVLKGRLEKRVKRQIEYVENTLGIKVKLNPGLEAHGKVSYYGDTPVVELNPDRLLNDTVFHEAIGHIYINAIGGLENKRVSALAKRMGISDLSEGNQLEAIANVIGKEASEVFESQDKRNSFQRFKDWLFESISKL